MWAISLGIWPLMSRTECAFVVSDFRRDVDENCALLVYYAARIGNSLPTFRDNLSIPPSRVLWFCAHFLHTKLQLSWRLDTPRGMASLLKHFYRHYRLWFLFTLNVLAYFIFDLRLACGWNFFPLFLLFCYTALLTRYIFTKLSATPPPPPRTHFSSTQDVSLSQ